MLHSLYSVYKYISVYVRIRLLWSAPIHVHTQEHTHTHTHEDIKFSRAWPSNCQVFLKGNDSRTYIGYRIGEDGCRTVGCSDTMEI
jgi:hypothetical protein